METAAAMAADYVKLAVRIATEPGRSVTDLAVSLPQARHALEEVSQ
jgi:hypothetical protein